MPKVVVFRDPKEQEKGLLRFASERVPNDTVFVFVDVPRGAQVHTRGMKETIRVYMLDENLKPLASVHMVPERRIATFEGTRHIVETSEKMPVIGSFNFLKKHV